MATVWQDGRLDSHIYSRTAVLTWQDARLDFHVITRTTLSPEPGRQFSIYVRPTMTYVNTVDFHVGQSGTNPNPAFLSGVIQQMYMALIDGSGNEYTRVTQLRNQSGRVSLGFTVPAGVTTIYARLGSGGFTAQGGKLGIMTQPKMEKGSIGSGGGISTGYVPGIAAQPTGGISSPRIALGPASGLGSIIPFFGVPSGSGEAVGTIGIRFDAGAGAGSTIYRYFGSGTWTAIA